MFRLTGPLTLATILTIAATVNAAPAMLTTVPLTSGWEFRQAGTTDFHAAEVPGCVHTDLLRLKMIPDPFVGTNEKDLQWIGKTDWEYRVSFDASASLLAREHVDLVFEGLDTYATVRLNGQTVLEADNMFRVWRIDAKPHLREGANDLDIVFRSPINEILPILQTPDAALPASNDQGEKTSPFTRKAPYHFGWDWGPRFVTAGVWRPVRLEAWDVARIASLAIRTTEATEQLAKLTVDVELTGSPSAAWPDVGLAVFDPAGRAAGGGMAGPGTAATGSTRSVRLLLEIRNPQRWWPAGYGGQPLYRFVVRLASLDEVLDEHTVWTGIRTLELRRTPDAIGRSFTFVVNGVPIFAKGANWVPADSFVTRITGARYEQLLRSARDANMNMLRVWGGGIYEADEFYELADELGILLWHDLMFACSMYPGDQHFLDNVAAEVTDNVVRLRNHPSIVLWCGNNEVEAAWRGWGWKNQYPAHLWDDYKALFDRTIPDVLAKTDPGRPYWPSSPSANSDEHPLDPNYGDEHYWGVWHATEPFSNFEKHSPRFMSEYGFQSFPELRTVETFATPDQYAIESPVMLAHQKNARGNQIIREYMLREYRQPKDFESFLYVSQVLQAEGIKMGAEHMRRARPRTMGSLYWQLDDCWPVASWSSIDYYGRWKALQYYARRFYQDVLVSPLRASGGIEVWLVSDRQAPTAGTVRARLLDFAGRELWKEERAVTLAPLSSANAWTIDEKATIGTADPRTVFLQVELLDRSGRILSENRVFFDVTKNLPLPSPVIDAAVTARGNLLAIRLHSPVLARQVHLAAGETDGTFSDDYFDLLPGRDVEVTFTPARAMTPDELKTVLRIRSITDAF